MAKDKGPKGTSTHDLLSPKSAISRLASRCAVGRRNALSCEQSSATADVMWTVPSFQDHENFRKTYPTPYERIPIHMAPWPLQAIRYDKMVSLSRFTQCYTHISWKLTPIYCATVPLKGAMGSSINPHERTVIDDVWVIRKTMTRA